MEDALGAFRPDLILAELERHDVRYVLIGGLAAVLHGSAAPTFDVDITPEPAEHNLARLSDALRALGARIRVDGPCHSAVASRAAGTTRPSMTPVGVTPQGVTTTSTR